jgi:hypothetical protein
MSTPFACTEVRELLPWLANGTLETAERRGATEHLIGCADCRRQLAETRRTLALVQRGLGAEAPGKLLVLRTNAPAAARPGAPLRARMGRRSFWWAGGAIAATMIWAVAQGYPGALRQESLQSAGRMSAPAARTAAAPAERLGGEIVFEDSFEGGRMDRWNPTYSAATQL